MKTTEPHVGIVGYGPCGVRANREPVASPETVNQRGLELCSNPLLFPHFRSLAVEPMTEVNEITCCRHGLG